MLLGETLGSSYSSRGGSKIGVAPKPKDFQWKNLTFCGVLKLDLLSRPAMLEGNYDRKLWGSKGVCLKIGYPRSLVNHCFPY